MVRKLTDKDIVGEAMYSVRRSLTANIVPPPTNPDGTFKSLDQMRDERLLNDWEQQKQSEEEYNNTVKLWDDAISNDDEQIAWEEEQNMNSASIEEYHWEVPDSVKISFYAILLVICVAFILGHK